MREVPHSIELYIPCLLSTSLLLTWTMYCWHTVLISLIIIDSLAVCTKGNCITDTPDRSLNIIDSARVRKDPL